MVVTLEKDNKLVHYTVENAQSEMLLSDILQQCGIPFDMPCGGRGTCRKCRVWVSGALQQPGAAEQALLTPQELAEGIRYACMAKATGDVTVRLSEKGESAILTKGDLAPHILQPWGKEYGIVVDIGTTTLAGYLYRLSDEAQLATAAMPNPQAVFGADVISRLQASSEGQSEALAQNIRNGLLALMRELTVKAGTAPERVDAVVLTGNTAMLYLLTQHPVNSLIAVPFEQDRCFGEMHTASELFGTDELPVNPAAAVYLPRTVAAYVGADITTAMMTTGFDGVPAQDGVCLLADIGTNGEMALWTPDQVYVCSTAAGPAFEGAGLSCGMSARDGAINKVEYRDGKLVSQVIGGGTAVGMCGSGVVDAIAALLKAGVMDETGRLWMDGHDFEEAMCTVDGQPAIRLPETTVVLTQADVRAIQLAKSAIAAGMLALLNAAGLKPQQVKTLYLAGGFGNCIDVGSAADIGLIPQQLADAAKPVGNAAGAGAAVLLLDKEKKAASETLAANAKNLELSTDPYFMDQYVEQMMFGGDDYM